jgi:hypothetical protein
LWYKIPVTHHFTLAVLFRADKLILEHASPLCFCHTFVSQYLYITCKKEVARANRKCAFFPCFSSVHMYSDDHGDRLFFIKRIFPWYVIFFHYILSNMNVQVCLYKIKLYIYCNFFRLFMFILLLIVALQFRDASIRFLVKKMGTIL